MLMIFRCDLIYLFPYLFFLFRLWGSCDFVQSFCFEDSWPLVAAAGLQRHTSRKTRLYNPWDSDSGNRRIEHFREGRVKLLLFFRDMVCQSQDSTTGGRDIKNDQRNNMQQTAILQSLLARLAGPKTLQVSVRPIPTSPKSLNLFITFPLLLPWDSLFAWRTWRFPWVTGRTRGGDGDGMESENWQSFTFDSVRGHRSLGIQCQQICEETRILACIVEIVKFRNMLR